MKLLAPCSFLFLFYTHSFAASPLPEAQVCLDWEKSFNEIVDQTKDGPHLKKKPVDLLNLIGAYPKPATVRFTRDLNEKIQDAVMRIMNPPECRSLKNYDSALLFLKLTEVSKEQRKKFVGVISQQVADQVEFGNLISFSLMTDVIHEMIKKKFFVLSDAAFFEFSQILDEQSQNNIRMNRPDRRQVLIKCDMATCSDDDARAALDTLQEDSRQSKRLYHRLLRWMERIEAK